MSKHKFIRNIVLAMGCLAIPAIGQESPAGPQLANDPKVSASLRHRATLGEMLSVVVVLADQPHADVVHRWHGAFAPRLAALNTEVRRLAGVRNSQLTRRAMANRDAAVMEMRRGIAAELRGVLGADQEFLAARLNAQGARNIRRYWVKNMIAAEIPASALPDLEADPKVLSIEETPVYHRLVSHSVPAMGAPAFWEAGFDGSTQAVAVIDTGVSTKHPDFHGLDLVAVTMVNNASTNPCFADDGKNPEDFLGHGSHVSGIVTGRGSARAPDARGVAPGLGALVSIRVFARGLGRGNCPDDLGAHTVDILTAVELIAEETPVRVINLSLGSDSASDDDGMARFIDFVADAFDLSIVVAAGNNGKYAGYQVGTPGTAYNILSVANVNTMGNEDRSDDRIAVSSSKGPTPAGRFKPDLAAPGSDILSADYESDGYVRMTGTSMAAPHITGAVALLYDAGVEGSKEAKALLLNSTDTAGWRRDWGWGSTNLNRALSQKDYVISSTVASSTALFFRGKASESLRATLVWNRHVGSKGWGLQNLDLFAYDATTRQEMKRSASSIQNVEQVEVPGEGEVILTVRSASRVSSAVPTEEQFALAVSAGGFRQVGGPSLRSDCAAPAAVRSGERFDVSCRLTNTGQLAATGIKAALALPTGFVATETPSFGTLEPGSSREGVFHVQAEAASGTTRIAVVFTSNSFGATLEARQELSFKASAPEVRLSAASLAFRLETKAAAPAEQMLSVTSSTPIRLSAAVTGGTWLKATASSATTPATITVTVSARDLAPGTYNGSVRVQPAGAGIEAIEASVVLVVEPARFELVKHLLSNATYVPSGCTPPQAATAFTLRDPYAHAWFTVKGATKGDVWQTEWYAPDNVLYKASKVDITYNGSMCAWSSISIAREYPAPPLGLWQVRVYWNGKPLFSESFTLSGR